MNDVNQAMLNVDLEEKKRLVRTLFYKGLISAGMYVDLITGIYQRQIKEQTYQPTLEEISKYWG